MVRHRYSRFKMNCIHVEHDYGLCLAIYPYRPCPYETDEDDSYLEKCDLLKALSVPPSGACPPDGGPSSWGLSR